MSLTEHARKNRLFWDRQSDQYQELHSRQLDEKELAWGIWALPEAELGLLGEYEGLDVLEFGCGAAQWSIFLAKRGARMVGLDNSERQLHHARQRMARHGVDFPLIHASAEDVPLPDASFDLVFCDHGAMTFADPFRTVPEAARLLRTGGRFVFNMVSPILHACYDFQADRLADRLLNDYFSLRRMEDDECVDFQLPYGDWIALFRRCGLAVEDLVELRPPENAETTYDTAPLIWARRWPAENVWRLRKEA